MSSSSSENSSEDDEHWIETLLPEILQHRNKNELYAEETALLYTEKEFLDQFKVPRALLSKLSTDFESSDFFSKADTGFLRVPAEKCMWVFCWYASHEAASFRDVSDRFNIALSTLHNIIVNVTLFLSNKAKDIITWPTEAEKNQILEDFAAMGFPDVLGCIDGTHVRIDKPDNDPESYLNRKKFYSIQVSTAPK